MEKPNLSAHDELILGVAALVVLGALGIGCMIHQVSGTSHDILLVIVGAVGGSMRPNSKQQPAAPKLTPGPAADPTEPKETTP